jgi:monofunctional biosynthetic peptidoglycan transglycosylase
MPCASATDNLLDFADAGAASAFRVINDGVMGGVSSSQLRLVDGALRFEGELSLENNGGFASFRGPVRIAPGVAALLLTVRGDGKRYKLTLKPDDGNSSPQYQARFTAPAQWNTLRFVPTDFSASFRGRAVDAPALDFGSMGAIGLLISDRQAGPFRVELGRVCTERP